jgi:hypothetical protein
MWEFFATFGGPIATLVASVAALIVTARFSSIQAGIARSHAETAAAQRNIAQSQRGIAYDKLEHDLFDKRYEIYSAAKFIMERITRTGLQERPIEDMELLEKRIKMDEAQFFFPRQEVELFERIDALVTQHEVARMGWLRDNANDEIRRRTGDEMAWALEQLAAIHREFAKLMKDEMGFGQLTIDTGGSHIDDSQATTSLNESRSAHARIGEEIKKIPREAPQGTKRLLR